MTVKCQNSGEITDDVIVNFLLEIMKGVGLPVGGQLSIELTNPVIVLKLVCEAEAG